MSKHSKHNFINLQPVPTGHLLNSWKRKVDVKVPCIYKHRHLFSEVWVKDPVQLSPLQLSGYFVVFKQTSRSNSEFGTQTSKASTGSLLLRVHPT